MQTKWNFLSVDENEVESLQRDLGISPLLCQLLVQKGIKTYDQAKQFFRPKLQHLHDPFLMKNMQKAVARLERAIEQRQRILLYGDYDVDGTCSVALMYTFLKSYHKNLIYYIPDRYKEGYGISKQGIEFAKSEGVHLIVAMDCGVKAIAEIDLANSYKIDCIVCDHHLPSDELPDAYAMLNPKQADCPYPYKELTGCGITFKLAQAYQTRIAIDWSELENLLDLLVVSIGCDIVPITGENRVMAYFGLKKLNTNPRQGLQALIEVSGQRKPLSIRDAVFGLGPLINAAGRLSDAKLAVDTMLAEESTEAKKAAQVLVDLNISRRNIELLNVESAKEQFTSFSNWENRKSIVLFDPDWNKGVVGIVAARMVDTFYHPSIVLTQSEGKVVGSARSVRGFNIYQAIQRCSDLLLGYGGHQHAAGLTMLPENIEAFRERFEKVVQQTRSIEQIQPEMDIAACLKLEDITPAFWKILKQFAPFGPKNRNPIFVTKNVFNTPRTRVLKNNHLKLEVYQHESPVFNGIGFGLADHYEAIKDNAFDICYNINENIWKGKTTLQLNVKDIKKP